MLPKSWYRYSRWNPPSLSGLRYSSTFLVPTKSVRIRNVRCCPDNCNAPNVTASFNLTFTSPQSTMLQTPRRLTHTLGLQKSSTTVEKILLLHLAAMEKLTKNLQQICWQSITQCSTKSPPGKVQNAKANHKQHTRVQQKKITPANTAKMWPFLLTCNKRIPKMKTSKRGTI